MAIEQATNVIQLEFWQLVKMAASVAVAILGAGWFLVKVIVGQFTSQLRDRFEGADELREQRDLTLNLKLSSLEKLISTSNEGLGKLEREFLDLKAELPQKYVLREDDIRKETLMHSKLDALANKIDKKFSGEVN